MNKILFVSDCGVPTGYGRIADNVAVRLTKRGYNVLAASFAYDGLLPPMMDGQRLPYHVAPLQGRADWPNAVASMIGAYDPDVVLVAQDAPYGEALRNAPVDWSRHGFVMLTPVDGAPIYPSWTKMMAQADAALTISQFGVEAYRKAGVATTLCRPGVDPNTFFRLPEAQRLALRQALGLTAEHFIVGTFAMNQGRKCISLMVQAFFEFAVDKPHARYLMDMEEVSPGAGWNVAALCEQYGYDASKLIFRADAVRAGITDVRDRMNLMDAHMVISHREGYGLPLAEAMACGVVGIALDYCSGPEIVGDGKGMLIPCTDVRVPGTWGGAEDRFPNMTALVGALQTLHDDPAQRAVIAQRGMTWARAQSWDAAADAVQTAIDKVLAQRASVPPPQVPLMALQQPLPQSVDGMAVPA